MSREMTEADLLAAIDECMGGGPDLEGGLTVNEIARAKNKSARTVQVWLEKMASDGRLITGWKSGTDACGRRIRRPAYKLRG